MSIDLPHPKFSSLSLSPLVMNDASEMFIHLNDEETVQYLLGPPFPLSMDQIKDYISSRPLFQKYPLTFSIRNHQKMIGEVSLVPQETPHTYELGYYLARPYWNNGITTVAVKTFLNMIVKQLRCGEDIRIEAGYIMNNAASGNVLKKCGFTQIGYEEKMKDGKTLQGVKMVRIIVDKEQQGNHLFCS